MNKRNINEALATFYYALKTLRRAPTTRIRRQIRTNIFIIIIVNYKYFNLYLHVIMMCNKLLIRIEIK